VPIFVDRGTPNEILGLGSGIAQEISGHLQRRILVASKQMMFVWCQNTDLKGPVLNVCFSLNSRHSAAAAACRFCANNGLMHRSKQHRHSITSSARSGSDVGTSMRPCRLEA
jgi:hypothetical protein